MLSSLWQILGSSFTHTIVFNLYSTEGNTDEDEETEISGG